jgi:hypothetical protein
MKSGSGLLLGLLAAFLLVAGISCRGREPAQPPAAAPPGVGVAFGDGLVVGPPSIVGNLAVYPIIITREVSPCGYDTLETALAKKTVVIAEVGGEDQPAGQASVENPPPGEQPQEQQLVQIQNGSVNTLMIQNNGGVAIILMAGDIIKGGKQDRTIAHDAIIPPHSKPVDVSVFCVEAGRWQGQACFEASPVLADNAIRKTAQCGKGQQAIWNEVASSNWDLVGGGQSGTYLLGAEDGAVKEQIAKVEGKVSEALAQTAGLVGLAVTVEGRLVCADIYHDPALFSQVLKRLLRSYALESVKAQKSFEIADRTAIAQGKKPAVRPDPAKVTPVDIAQQFEKLRAQTGENVQKSAFYENWQRKKDNGTEFELIDSMGKHKLHLVAYWD